MTIRTLQKKTYTLSKNDRRKISEIFCIPEEKIEFFGDMLFLVAKNKKFIEEEEIKSEEREIDFTTDDAILKNVEEYIKLFHGE